ncbi:unnamed protein product [Albugo candida]|uniref:Uncharacterized protein n=1 Tax=Albugo candida TaxID=65357 RepID=A0A024FXY9_9STRA|nr:unnamed protein product [Albugo candida]|eukprot:CCI11504.1 unnamed protein product [Albugo candida]
MIHEAVKSAKEYGKEANPTANRMNQINSDIRGMISSESNFKLGWLISRHEVKSGAKENSMTDKKSLQKIQEILFLEAFLSTKRWSCGFLDASQSRRPELLNCIIDKVAGKNGFFLVTSPSVTKLIILFDSYAINDYTLRVGTKIYCYDSPYSGVKKHVDCDDYRNQHITNPIVYQELWMFENVIPENKPCLFIPQILTTFETCGDCMKSFFYAVTGGAERTLESNYVWEWPRNQHAVFGCDSLKRFTQGLCVTCLAGERTVSPLNSNSFCFLVQVKLGSRPINRSFYAGCTSKQRKLFGELNQFEYYTVPKGE